MKTTSKKLEFRGSRGDTLAARLDTPLGPPKAYALFAHCFTCSKDSLAASRISRGLSGLGIAVLRFDFTGLGNSGGDFANTSFSSNVEDLVLAADYLRAQYAAPRILIGHSLGGAAVIAAAAGIAEAAAVVTIGAPADPEHVTRLLTGDVRRIEAEGEGTVSIAGRDFRIRKQFLDDLQEQKVEEAVSSLRKALLVMHAPFDDVVGIDNAARIFTAAKHPKSFVSLDQADHMLSKPEYAHYVANVLTAWASRYVEVADTPSRDTGDSGDVIVRETGESPYAQEILAGPHRLSADEPPSVGGSDSGPTPYGLLLAALGACTSMTIRMYADRKKWPLETTTVRLRHEKIHARDCQDCETAEGKIDRIEREIEIIGDLDATQREKLMEIADKCPVHRTLHAEVRIETKSLAPARSSPGSDGEHE